MKNNINKFFKKNFYILEAEEVPSKNKIRSRKKRIRNKTETDKNNNKYTYGISEDKSDTALNNNTSKEIKKHRVLFNDINKQEEKIIKNKNKKFLRSKSNTNREKVSKDSNIEKVHKKDRNIEKVHKDRNIEKVHKDTNKKKISKDTNIQKDKIQNKINNINIKKVQLKRKSDNLNIEKNNDNIKIRVKNHISKNIKKIDNILGIINGKLNISFKTHNTVFNNNGNEIYDKQSDDDKELERLKNINEYNKIKQFTRNNNKDFIKRIKDNNSFIKNNNIILADNNNIEKKKNFNLKIYQLKGCYLKK